MKRFLPQTLIVVLVVLAFGTLQSSALARSPAKHYVPRLKSTFAIYRASIPGHGRITVASPIDPDQNSPLRDVKGLSQGLITHLDGYRATSFRELNNHIRWTKVRWIDPNGRVHNDKIYIPE